VGNILKRHGLPPAPERKTTTWKEFIRTHMDVLVATDFFTAEVWTLSGLVTYYILFFIHLGPIRPHQQRRTKMPFEFPIRRAYDRHAIDILNQESWGALCVLDARLCWTFLLLHSLMVVT